MVGLCPFHNEKSPSFTVFTSTQNFYCFGCSAGGDVINFIKRVENLEYVDALRFLARRAGIKIPENEQTNGVRRTRILELNKETARYFRSRLLESSDAKRYFVNRGLSSQIVTRFGLGYAPAFDNDALFNHLKTLGYSLDEMVAAKLIYKGKSSPFPYFRNRVIFPIIDLSGSVVGFGGRVLDDSKPKYLNTPETVAFKKGSVLFALNFAKEHCAESLILCEGYMDVIALHSHGFQNAVAALSATITPEQVRTIKRLTKKVIIAYDGDTAGKNAAEKATTMLTEIGLDVKILQLKDAKDPDEYIKKFGSEAFRKLLDNSTSKIDFILENALSKFNLTLEGDIIRAANAVCAEYCAVYSAVERELLLEKASNKLGISRESLKVEAEKLLKKKYLADKTNYENNLKNQAKGIGDKVNHQKSQHTKAAISEEALIGILMMFPEQIKPYTGGENGLNSEDFLTDFNKKVFLELLRVANSETCDLALLNETFSNEEMSKIYAMMIKRQQLTTNTKEVFDEFVVALRREKLKTEDDILKILEAKQNETT